MIVSLFQVRHDSVRSDIEIRGTLDAQFRKENTLTNLGMLSSCDGTPPIEDIVWSFAVRLR
jgi:hypothetical protein